MKELKFTPAPWKLSHYDGDLSDFNHHERDTYRVIKAGFGYCGEALGAPDEKGFTITQFLSEPDAILISKAPEMYSALLKAKTALLNVTTYSDPLPGSVGDEVNKAISEINKILEA